MQTLCPERQQQLQRFSQTAGVRFRSYELLNLAFSHRSYSNEQNLAPGNNERLEFLGDSVLGLIVSEYLFLHFPDRSEGDLAKMKAFIVSEECLAETALSLGVPDCLLLGKGEENSGGRTKKAILADAMEAIFGAIFIDLGMQDAKHSVLKALAVHLEDVEKNRQPKDYKTLLQEYTQKNLRVYPRYSVVDRHGPDHAKIYDLCVQIGDKSWGPASGASKKEAEQSVARLAWEALNGLKSN